MKQIGYGIEVGASLASGFRSTMGQTERSIGTIGVAAKESGRALDRHGRQADETARRTNQLGRTSRTLGGAMRRTRESVERATRGVAAYGRSLGNAAREARRLRAAGSLAGRGLDAASNRYSAAISALGVGATVRTVGNLQERFVRLGIQANHSAQEIAALQREIYATSLADGVRVDANEVTAAVETIVEKTGDLGLARDNLRNIAMAIQASGSAGADIGSMIAGLATKYDVSGGEEVLRMLDRFVEQGKFANFALRDQANMAERLMAAYAGTGRIGEDAVSEQGALIQIFRGGTGSAEQAVTAFERTFAELVSKSEEFEDLGVEIWDADALAEGRREMRAGTDVLKDVIRATEGDVKALGDLFGDEAIRGVRELAREYSQTGGFATLDELLGTGGSGEKLADDAGKASRTFNQALGSLGTAWTRFASARLTGPIDALATAISALGADGADTLFTLGTGLAAVVGTAIAGRRAYQALGLGRRNRGGPNSDQLMRNQAGAMAGVQQVFVTNMPRDFGGGVGGGGRRRRGTRRTRGRGLRGLGAGLVGGNGSTLGRAVRGGGRLLSRAAVPLAVGLGALDMVSAAQAGDAEGIGSAGGGLAGALGGAAAGAAIGSVVPIVGTAIGGVIGGLVGGLGGEWLGGLIGRQFDTPEAVPPTAAAPAPSTPASEAAPTAAPATPQQISIKQEFHIQAAPGMDVEELARLVAQRMEAANRRALSD